MSRIAANLVASALLLSPWLATAATSTVQTQAVRPVGAASNQSPLPPGGAAGIKEAQGLEGGPYWFEVGLAIGAVIVIWILMDDQDFETTTTTGT
jgi:hypothetical protein